MSRAFFGTLALLLIASPLAAAGGSRIQLVARDLQNRPVSGVRFSYGGVESLPTNRSGATELDLPPQHPPGRPINLLLIPGADDWFLVNFQINIPSGSDPAEVVLMPRREFRQFAAETVLAPQQTASRPAALTAEDRKRVLVEAADRYGLTAVQLETALRSFANTQDPKDRGIAAYLRGQFAQAEGLLQAAADRKLIDFVETLRYLGAAQYEQAKYRAAADTFRLAVALRSEDAYLLGWLGNSLRKLAEWDEAEPLLRRALAIDEHRYGAEDPAVAVDLNNLAALLKDTMRSAEAELLIRRALAIDEKICGHKHPRVATDLRNLAQLLQATNRVAEAEPLIRRALAIVLVLERGHEYELLSRDKILDEYRLLLREMGSTEVEIDTAIELVERRALEIEEKSFGPQHPNVATDRNNLARLLQATTGLAEAEPLMRRHLLVFLEFSRRSGPEHPHLRAAFGNYAGLLKAMGKSDAEIDAALMTLVRPPP